MFLTWYRDIIAKQVENKMLYLDTCQNDKNIILNIISPKTYKRKSVLYAAFVNRDISAWTDGIKSEN